MFLGCTPCCSVCPNYYQILDSADYVQLLINLNYADGTGQRNAYKNLFSGSASNVVTFRPESKTKGIGTVSMRAYGPTGYESQGQNDNYYKITATPYSCTFSAHVNEPLVAQEWFIQEHKCMEPNLFQDTENLAAWESAFSLDETARKYKTSKGSCSTLVFGSWAAYANLPYNSLRSSSSPTTPLYFADSLQDWSFIYPMPGTERYDYWLSEVDMGSSNFPQFSTTVSLPWYKGGNRPYVTTQFTSVGDFFLEHVCARPYESQSFTDFYEINQDTEFVRRWYDRLDNDGRAYGQIAGESLLLRDAWAFIGNEKVNLRQTQPSYGDAYTHWQLHYSLVANTQNYITRRAFGDGGTGAPGPTATICEQMGPAYGF